MAKLKELARRQLGRPDADAALRALVSEVVAVGGSTQDAVHTIADRFGVSRELVRYHLKRLGLHVTRTSFKEKIGQLGYKHVYEFFRGNRGRTKTELAQMTGFTIPAVTYWQEEYLREVMRRKAAGEVL